jgi:hypothetical protein
MVHGIASMEFTPGRREEAVEYLKKVCETLKRYGAKHAELLRRVTSAPGQNARLYIMTTFDSLVSWAQTAQDMREDKGFQELQREAGDPDRGCVVHNTFSRNLLEVM